MSACPAPCMSGLGLPPASSAASLAPQGEPLRSPRQCGPALRSNRGLPPAWHRAREALAVIIRLAGQAPSRFRLAPRKCVASQKPAVLCVVLVEPRRAPRSRERADIRVQAATLHLWVRGFTFVRWSPLAESAYAGRQPCALHQQGLVPWPFGPLIDLTLKGRHVVPR